MIIVSFATTDKKYTDYAVRLVESAEEAGMKIKMSSSPGGSHKDINLRKPMCIRRVMDHCKDRVMWMDADSCIVRQFSLPEGDWDIGLVPHFNERLRKKNPMCAHLIAVQDTEAARRFLAVWEYLCAWSNLTKYHDHKRLTWTRIMLEGEYKELDITEYIRGAIISDYGNAKEHRF